MMRDQETKSDREKTKKARERGAKKKDIHKN